MTRVLSSPFARSLFVVIGGGIGAGMFGLPAIFSGSGLLWGSVIYWSIFAFVLVIHLLYAELQTKAGSQHGLPGVVRRSLGRPGWLVALVTYPLNVYGTSLVYLLLGSQFLSALSGAAGGPTSLLGWQLVLWLLFAWGAHKGVKGVVKFERPTMFILIIGLLVISALAMFSGQAPHIALFSTNLNLSAFIGVVFFTCISLPTVAETMELNRRSAAVGRRALVVGLLASAGLKWVFAITFAGATQAGVLRVSELMSALPVAVGWLIPLMGVFAISGAAVSMLDSLRILYRDEFAFRPFNAWLLAVLPSLALLYTSQEAVLPLMGLLGSCVAAVNATLICFSALRERNRLIKRIPRPIIYATIGVCLFAVLHQFIPFS